MPHGDHLCSHRSTEQQPVDNWNHKWKYLDPTFPSGGVFTWISVLRHFDDVRGCRNRSRRRSDFCCDYELLDLADSQLYSLWD